jgi:hypothetical protein
MTTGSIASVRQAQLRLPAAFRHMVYCNQNNVPQLDSIGADVPSSVISVICLVAILLVRAKGHRQYEVCHKGNLIITNL